MFSKQSMIDVRHRLAFRLTVWYAGVFMLSAFLAFLFFYALITSVMRQQTDQDLLGEIRTFSSLLSVQGAEAVKQQAFLKAQAGGEQEVFFRLLSITGQVFSSSNMSYWSDIGINRAAINRLLAESRPVFDTIRIPDRQHDVRVLYAVIGPGMILQVGRSMQNHARVIEVFRKIFVTTMSGLFLLAVLVGWFMAKRALGGVERVTQTARRIAGGRLDERVPLQKKADEIDQLATTFNQMLDHIQKLMTEIKEMNDNIAHDLKSPITRIRGIAEVSMTTGAAVSDYENMAASIVEECDRLLDMINTMLIISRTEAGVHQMERKPIDITGVVREACELFGLPAEEKNVRLVCDIPETCWIHGDIRMIQRMTANLIDNAIKYTSSGGQIEVSVFSNHCQSVLLAVKDNGMGISAKDLPHIFERFYRCDPSRSQAGTGLGLSFALAVARAHGGDISVVSALNEGSTFTVHLPKIA
jgi:heavy metal sensor kinase